MTARVEVRLEQWFPKAGLRTIFGLQTFEFGPLDKKDLLKIKYFKQIFAEVVNNTTSNVYQMVGPVGL
jgi:hypothetical protein